MKKHFPTFIHESCLGFDAIYVSAGKRGLQLHVNPADLIAEVKATLGYLIISQP
jgi:Cys-tRNA(Pro)/Cys-tRNA(Cys) deacylase